MIEKIQRIKAEIEALKVSKSEDLENIRIKYLSKKGEISQLFNDFRTVAAEQKREVGKQLNELKTLATERINALKSEFEDTHSESQNIDLTRTAYPIPLGSRHPLSLVKNEICDIFARLGFSIAEGPEIEDDWHVFSAFCRRPPGSRYAGHILYTTFSRYSSSYTHLVCTNKNDGALPTPYPHHLSGSCLPQRSYILPGTLLFPSSRSLIYRQKCFFCRFEASVALFCQRNVRIRNSNSTPSFLFPVYRTFCRNGYIL